MKKEDISRLLELYLSARKIGKEPYFDADEIDELLGSFEEAENYEHFEEVLTLGLKLHPNSTDLQIRQCKLYVYNEEYDSALALITSIAETDNQDLDILRLECYCMTNRHSQAIRYTERLINDNCDYLESLFEYITPLLSDAEMHEEAYDFIKLGMDLFPNNLTLKEELCYHLEMKEEFDKAIGICNELIDKDPYAYEYWFTLGRLYSFKLKFEKAIEAFDFALTCNDSEPELKLLKAYCLYMNDNYEKALEVYQDINADLEMEERIKPLMAECYIKLEHFEEAYKILKELIEKETDDKDPTSYINFIRCCAETERDPEASEALTKAVELFPYNIRILSMLALAYVKSGKEKLALETTEHLFDLLNKEENYQPEDYESLFYAGQYLYMKGEVDKALKYYHKVYAINPTKPYIHLHIAMAYLAKGDMQQFYKHFCQTSPKEFIEYMENAGINLSDVKQQLRSPYIPPEDLAKEYLKNKDNNN